MIKNTAIDRCLKSDFKAIEQISEKRFILRWGKKDGVERVYAMNELTGEPEFTGEVRDTDWCTYEAGVYEGALSPYWLDKALEGRTRFASVHEYKAMYDAMGLDEERQIPLLKEKLKDDIRRYDKSKAVENFTINGVDVWLDKDTRTGLLLRFQAEQAIGKTDTTLWYNGVAFPLMIESGIQMLFALEVYASKTYDLKEYHLATVDGLQTVEEILAYDYTSGYPEQLSF